MITKKEIVNELRNIKYYYSRKKKLDNGFENTGKNNITNLLDKYNPIVNNLKPKLYDIYIGLYLNNHTQYSLADELGVSQSYVNKENLILIDTFYKEFNKEENVCNS